ncbi:hypothetical protein CPARA_3gp407 (nucleomorph) [Cryptomonas paramecium]|uniref:Uncharacterized protein n=1 Tax=Cryptomonas paramaecium TaxID=2898 RepID=F2HIE1_9CRYP|nr:hypothetical protein CPARA_3gp407 [Cryptomonas paramecium]AEA39065.1 hypothetical protein CPARA_3gp407 [Cryptomonas paramecium]
MNQPYKMFKCNYSKKQDLTFQVISRKILNCLILYKKFANFFTLSSFVFDFKQWLNFYIIIDIKYIIYFLYSFIYHIFNYFSQSKSKLYLYNFCKIIEYYTDLIEYKSKFIENFGFYLPFRKKTFDEYFNIDLTYELSFFNFLKITYIQLFSKIKEYIIYRKNVYFDFFSVKKATKYEFLFGHDRLKPNINLKKIPFYFGIDLIKKFLIISIYVVHINLITKPSINYKKMFSLENFIDYTVIKLFKNMACNFQIIFCNFLVSENISFSSNKLIKKKLFIFLNMRYSVYFTLYQSFFEVKNFNLFLFFLASFEKKNKHANYYKNS